jgi:hypothetical protein
LVVVRGLMVSLWFWLCFSLFFMWYFILKFNFHHLELIQLLLIIKLFILKFSFDKNLFSENVYFA